MTDFMETYFGPYLPRAVLRDGVCVGVVVWVRCCGGTNPPQLDVFRPSASTVCRGIRYGRAVVHIVRRISSKEKNNEAERWRYSSVRRGLLAARGDRVAPELERTTGHAAYHPPRHP